MKHQFMVLATIPNFDRKKSYGSRGLYKSIKPAVKAEATVNVNKCVNTAIVRKKKVIDPAVKQARKESTFQNGKKPTLLCSSKLN